MTLARLCNLLGLEIERLEPRGDRHRRSLGHRPPGGVHDVEKMQVMRGIRERRPLLAQREDRLTKAVRPEPRRVDRLVFFPPAQLVSPDLETPRVPIVAEQVRRPSRPVELEPRPAVAL